LETAFATPWRFESLGLHSPAVSDSVEISRSPHAVMIDAGDRDPLERSARRLAAAFARSGVAVTELWPPGGHDRQYWRAHLRSYFAFHLTVHETAS
jgi:predicted esterase